jgi:hypothetical protein
MKFEENIKKLLIFYKKNFCVSNIIFFYIHSDHFIYKYMYNTTQTKTKSEYIYTNKTPHFITYPKFFYPHLRTVSVNGNISCFIPRTFNDPADSFRQFITVVNMWFTFTAKLSRMYTENDV